MSSVPSASTPTTISLPVIARWRCVENFIARFLVGLTYSKCAFFDPIGKRKVSVTVKTHRRREAQAKTNACCRRGSHVLIWHTSQDTSLPHTVFAEAPQYMSSQQ